MSDISPLFHGDLSNALDTDVVISTQTIVTLQGAFNASETVRAISSYIKNGLLASSAIVTRKTMVRVRIGKTVEYEVTGDTGTGRRGEEAGKSATPSSPDEGTRKRQRKEAPTREGGRPQRRVVKKYDTAEVDNDAFSHHSAVIQYLKDNGIAQKLREAAKDTPSDIGDNAYDQGEYAHTDKDEGGTFDVSTRRVVEHKEFDREVELEVAESMTSAWQEDFVDSVLMPLAREIMDQWMIAGVAIVRIVESMDDEADGLDRVPVIVPFSKVVLVQKYDNATSRQSLVACEPTVLTGGSSLSNAGYTPMENTIVIPFNPPGDMGLLRSPMSTIFRQMMLSNRHELASLEGHVLASRPAVLVQPDNVNLKGDDITGTEIIGGDVQAYRRANNRAHALEHEVLLVSQMERHKDIMRVRKEDLERMSTDPVTGMRVVQTMADDPGKTPFAAVPVGWKATAGPQGDVRYDWVKSSQFTDQRICAAFNFPYSLLYVASTERSAYMIPFQLQKVFNHYRGHLSKALATVVSAVLDSPGSVRVVLPSSIEADLLIKLKQLGYLNWDAVRAPLAAHYGMKPSDFVEHEPVPDEARMAILLAKHGIRGQASTTGGTRAKAGTSSDRNDGGDDGDDDEGDGDDEGDAVRTEAEKEAGSVQKRMQGKAADAAADAHK